ncbi:hypothetical protein PENTCL1PPCAC_16266 [Pristionchus entomophagus]|uniref:G protein-coupled receptor n=1 Tax=Pristionchus entomophagus TaxID=358040 RepID=A0AAV5TIF5_9BILA|nr:hypothetical protein PENTCL1PPCAC_16266 [Pristionchus entomophagus]
MVMRYVFDLDRDFLMDIAFRINSFLPIISSLTIYPANIYFLIVQCPSMTRDIRQAYLTNLVTKDYQTIIHIYFDWIFAFLIRPYAFPPYGLYYCEGVLCTAGLSKMLIMGFLISGIPMVITTYYILMLRLHQLAVGHPNSRWKLTRRMQYIVCVSITSTSLTNLAGFVIFGTDLDNYDELIKGPQLTWLVQRGGTLLLFGEPRKTGQFMKDCHILHFAVNAFHSSCLDLLRKEFKSNVEHKM